DPRTAIRQVIRSEGRSGRLRAPGGNAAQPASLSFAVETPDADQAFVMPCTLCQVCALVDERSFKMKALKRAAAVFASVAAALALPRKARSRRWWDARIA